jgi:hypothetical protein
MQNKHRALKALAKGLIIVLALTGILWARALYLQDSHLTAAEGYFRESNWKFAIREYDTAMHFYAPLSPYQGKAAGRLWKIGEMFEAQGEHDRARLAFSSIRSSLYASRSLYTPGKDWIDKCDEKIASLNVKIALKEGSLKAQEADAERAKVLQALRSYRAPDVLWSFLAVAGFFSWAGSVVFIIFKGFSAAGDMRNRYAIYGILSFVLAFSLWVMALLKA